MQWETILNPLDHETIENSSNSWRQILMFSKLKKLAILINFQWKQKPNTSFGRKSFENKNSIWQFKWICSISNVVVVNMFWCLKFSESVKMLSSQALGFREWRLWRLPRLTSIGPTWWAVSRQVTLSLDEFFFHLTNSIGTGLIIRADLYVRSVLWDRLRCSGSLIIITDILWFIYYWSPQSYLYSFWYFARVPPVRNRMTQFLDIPGR